MIKFNELSLNDKIWIEKILNKSGFISSDSAFGTMYVWKKAYKLKVARYENFLLRFYDGTEPGYAFPLGEGNLQNAIEILIEHAKSNKEDFRLIGISESAANTLEKIMPGRFLFRHVRDKDDYIYRTSDLINLSGKKYHSKRNHISKFSRKNNWKYEDINDTNINEIKKLAEEWYIENALNKNRDLQQEREAILLAIENFYVLNFKGGFIRVDGKPVAFTAGEEINKDVFVIHFEKALKNYAEAYTVINNEFAKRALWSYDFINREDDLGLEGLRRAKLSYYPIILLKKYEATLR